MPSASSVVVVHGFLSVARSIFMCLVSRLVRSRRFLGLIPMGVLNAGYMVFMSCMGVFVRGVGMMSRLVGVIECRCVRSFYIVGSVVVVCLCLRVLGGMAIMELGHVIVMYTPLMAPMLEVLRGLLRVPLLCMTVHIMCVAMAVSSNSMGVNQRFS